MRQQEMIFVSFKRAIMLQFDRQSVKTRSPPMPSKIAINILIRTLLYPRLASTILYHAIIETNKFDLIRLIQRVLKGNSISRCRVIFFFSLSILFFVCVSTVVAAS